MDNQNHCMSIKQARLIVNTHKNVFVVVYILNYTTRDVSCSSAIFLQQATPAAAPALRDLHQEAESRCCNKRSFVAESSLRLLAQCCSKQSLVAEPS